MSKKKVLIIDNYDSFVYILAQYIGELGAEPIVVRNDQITIEEIQADKPDGLLISPGPGEPKDAGISLDAIKTFAGVFPIFGVCLGHQCIGELYGGSVIRAPQLMHGKTSHINHTNSGVFTDLPTPVEATRYHSLLVERNTLPDELEITAETKDGLIMGLRHKELDVEGVQFHPESVLTNGGKHMIQKFLDKL